MQLSTLCSFPVTVVKLGVFVVLLVVDRTSSSSESDDHLDSHQVALDRQRRAPDERGFYSSDISEYGPPHTILKRAPGWGKRAPGWGKRAPGWGKRSGFDDASLVAGQQDDFYKRGWGKRGWGKRGWGKRDAEEEVEESHDALSKRAPGWGKRAPGWGKRAPGWGKRAPQWGKRTPQWGKRAPGWGKRGVKRSEDDIETCEDLENKVDILVRAAVLEDYKRIEQGCGNIEKIANILSSMYEEAESEVRK